MRGLGIRAAVAERSAVGANPEPSTRWKPIAPLDLARFPQPVISGNRGVVWRAAWYMICVIFFQSSVGGLLPSRAKAAILRLFGARIGSGLVCKPRVTIKYPWFLEIGDHVWLGELAWIDNQAHVTIGSNCCISQGAYLFTGNHDYRDPTFAFFAKPIVLNEGVWVAAFQRVGPGTVVPAHMLVAHSAGDSTTRRSVSESC